ncbi:glycosyltransferase family 4 protein [Mesobacillus maritimus]|uniref:glycosyltransferase family 4 protein n=1 Tax=Mesobacillus maritimus TaxID=1643336 RepID=UPI003850C621
MKKKVLLISQGFYPEIGSAGNRMKNIFQLLQLEGYEVEALTTEPTYPNKNLYRDEKFWNEEALNNNPSIKRVKIKNRKYSTSIFNRLIYYMEMAIRLLFFIIKDKEKYDFILVSSPPIFVGFVGLIAKIRYKRKLILDIRDLWPESLKGVGVFNYKIIIGFFSLLEKGLYRYSDYIIVNSLEFKEYICKNTSVLPSKIGFMPNSARLGEIPDKQSVSRDGKIKVIYTGNIGLAQDIDVLKELALQLRKENIDLSIVGYGMKKPELVEFVKLNQLTNVHFYSPVTRLECFKINMNHDIGFVSLNEQEVFNTVLPGKIVDYMTCRLPIVASVSGYAKKVIEEEKVGFVSESRNSKEIINYILHLSKHPDLRKQMAENEGRYIMEKFLWEDNINVLTNIFEEINYKQNNTVSGVVE